MCNGHIALIGRSDATGIQAATAVAENPSAMPDGPELPPTSRQLEYLRVLGARPEDVAVLNRGAAAMLIDQLTQERQQCEQPTEKQWAYLRRLGVPDRQMRQVRSKADASALIEDSHLSPTPEQMVLLRDLGASGAQLAALKTKASAALLIGDLQARPAV